MLIELRIRDFAVIERVSVRLEPGLNVLTGETGAGKSIIVGALSLLLGERASSDVVRPGAERAVIEGVFDIAGREDVLEMLSEQGIESEEGLLILRREVAAEGRNRGWVNGSASTATLIGAIGLRLVDLHGQHKHQTLLDAAEQREILDRFGDAGDLAESVAEVHTELRDVRSELEKLERRRREAEEKADFLRFQAEEIEAAGLIVGEAEELSAERHRLEHSEELALLSQELNHGLYASEESMSSRLDHFRRKLARLAEIDPALEESRDLLESAYHALEEVGRSMGSYSSRVEHSPGRLAEIRDRQDLIFRLRRKYGETVEDVIAVGERARNELELIEGSGLERRELRKQERDAAARLVENAELLSGRRRDAAKRLQSAVEKKLPQLGLGNGRFEVSLEPLEEVGSSGAEMVEFRVSLNVGFELRGLQRVASGGELSRLMLALKTILARVDRVSSLVFDEVDSGIGGRVGQQIGQELRRVARQHQVFVITHLASIAAFADHHLLVEKEEREGTTLTRLSTMDDDTRIGELARLLGGEVDGSAGLEHARELLNSARSAPAGSS